MPPLTEHLRTILHDNCASAVRSLQARGADAASEEAAKAKAAQVISALTAAVDNVQRQFVGGLRSALSPSVAAQAGAAVVAKMCEEAVKARCAPLLALASVDDVALRIYHSVSVMHTFSAEVTKSGAAGWLASLLCGRVTLDLPPDLHTFVTTAIARHLDKYIDGEVLSPADEAPEARDTPLLGRMQAEYSAKMGHDLPVSRPPRRLTPFPPAAHRAAAALTTPFPPPLVAQVPPELVLAVYTTHAIARSNTTHLFGELSMGQGRLPVSEGEQERHIAALARALAVAVARDFGAGRASIEGVDIDAPLIDDLARKHRALLYAQQRGLSRVLAEANRQGEVGRKEEMKRIFGVEI